MRHADLTPVARDVMKLPAGPGLILAPLVGAYLFNSLPWAGWALAARPDLVLVVLVFWAIHQPGSVGQGLAFALGLAMDVGDSMLLGQHALAYVIATYGAQVLRVRVLAFPMFEQTLHVLGLAAVAVLVLALLNLLLVYRYLPAGHELALVVRGDLLASLAEACLDQDWVGHGAIDVVIAADYSRTSERYGDRGDRYVQLEAGHAAQNLCLQATALKLGAVTVGAFVDDQVIRILHMPEEHRPLYVIPVGRPAS